MNNQLPILLLRSLVMFPYQEIKLELNNESSKSIIDWALVKTNSEVLIVSLKDELEIKPNIKDLPSIVTLANIVNKIVLPNGNIRITLRGKMRVRAIEYNMKDNVILANHSKIETPKYNLEEENGYIRKLKELVNEYVSNNKGVSNSILEIIKNINNLSKLTDIISISLELNYKDKCELLSETNYFERAKYLIKLINGEISSLEFDKKIDEELLTTLEQNEKEILIKEKINLLNKELGFEDNIKKECDYFNKKINSFKISKKIKDEMREEVIRFSRTIETSPEQSVIKAYLDFVTSLPWNKYTVDKKNIKEINSYLNKVHYGLDKAKTRVEEYLILKNKNKSLSSPILCLIGPPGTGKTTFARELAHSIGREFISISVGGLNDAGELNGHRRTYIGASAGKIMEGIKKCGVANPIILIDEVDKMVKDYKGDPASVLLEILDPKQNKEFTDNYVSLPFDLSNVIFILTANDEANIPSPLLDRLEVIEVNSYTLFDKIEIAKNYTLPRLGREYKFDYKKLYIPSNVIAKIANDYTMEAGMRDLERNISQIVRKNLINGLEKKVTIKESDLPKYLGNNKYSKYVNAYDKPGCVNVPARGIDGGRIINIECTMYEGSEIITTGSLGDVMKESVLISISYLKSCGKSLGIDSKKLYQSIHIHALDAASKKEGPSAGLAITTSIVSFLTNKKVPCDVALTGEISLEGRILKVGGIKEKIISSYNYGIKRVFIPIENIGDLEEVPRKIINKMNIIPVNNFIEVYDALFN